MSAYSKRKGIIVSILVALVIWLSINFILIKFQENQKKEENSAITLKVGQVYENERKNIEVEELKSLKENPENNVEEIIKNQYKSNGWRIFISKINLDAPISEGTEKEVLRRAVGHFKETPEWNGNVALAAHNRGYKYNFFQEIKRLEIGDTIEYQTEHGVRKYEVVKKAKIKETDLSCLENTKENKLTLITCVENMPEYRLCIQATQKNNI